MLSGRHRVDRLNVDHHPVNRLPVDRLRPHHARHLSRASQDHRATLRFFSHPSTMVPTYPGTICRSYRAGGSGIVYRGSESLSGIPDYKFLSLTERTESQSF